MLLYRIENALGFGPYIGGEQTDFFVWKNRPHFGARNPSPWDNDHEPYLLTLMQSWEDKASVKWQCACISMTQLLSWFDWDELARMTALGYRMVSLEVPDADVYVGNRQALFNPDRAKRIEFIGLPRHISRW